MTTRRALLQLPLALPLATKTDDYFPPPDAKGGWRTAANATIIKKLDDAFDYASQTSQHGGLLVVHKGHLIYERYFGRGHREALPELASCGKAFTTVATGILLKQYPKKFPQGLDTRVFTPEHLPAEAFPLNDERKRQITLGQLLSMSAGMKGTNPVYVKGQRQTWDSPTEDNGPWSTTDAFALRQPMWCNPGECYSYSTATSHIPAIIVRHVSGMEMEDYLRKHLTESLGFGTWGYAMYRPKLKSGIDQNGRMFHTPGGGSIAVRSTDMLRFGYFMMKSGRWSKRQILDPNFALMCGRSVPYNPHFTHSFNFNVNDDAHIKGVPTDAFWKGGSGGYCIYAVPSLDLVVYKMGGTESQYDPALTRLPVKYQYDGSRANWKPPAPNQIGDSTAKTLELTIAAVTS